ncbi:RimK family alpha-L-glutamate ligase [Micromonospora sp. LOL_025]|uniref:ATP-grasp domain-containing protein n=1 Tax=Micromonospora sp. LOL_025 TaxID=3345413 RepID=UPI003A88C39C
MTDHHQPTRGKPRVALVTCAELPDLDPDDRLLLEPLARRGVTVEALDWADPSADWPAYDLAVLRSPWDYVPRRDEFLAWASRVPALANPADVVRWNTDKRYLADLSAAGVRTVPTSWVTPGESWRPSAARGEYVVKPAVGLGSRDTGRYDLAEPQHRELAVAHVRRLTDAGRLAMVQPYLDAVDTAGETALLFLAGPGGPAFSHAVRKGPMLTGPDLGVDGLYRPEEITASTATPEQLAVADRALAAVPGGPGRLLYARVDLVPGPDGAPVLVELELTEPSLFLGHADGAADRLADAILAHLGRAAG